MMKNKPANGLSQKATIVLKALIRYAESDYGGDGWWSVPIANVSAHVKNGGMSGHEFAGYLSALTAAGLYREIEPGWGEVKK